MEQAVEAVEAVGMAISVTSMMGLDRSTFFSRKEVGFMLTTQIVLLVRNQ
jgi:hypothetical protein